MTDDSSSKHIVLPRAAGDFVSVAGELGGGKVGLGRLDTATAQRFWAATSSITPADISEATAEEMLQAARPGYIDGRATSAGVGCGADASLRVPRAHQTEPMAALDQALVAGSRAQLVMACGTGKTLIGRWYAERVQAVLTVVVVPSLNLVAQTLGEWRSAPGWPFEALITCSEPVPPTVRPNELPETARMWAPRFGRGFARA
jgi:Type III restriction enzyme, res subunit